MGSYDYVVVGAGSAGAVVASRLSEDDSVGVLLIEAGGSHRHMNVQVPTAFAKQFKTELDWQFYTEPEPFLEGRSLYHPRGKMLGGCSSMNAMIYIRGNRDDFDSWAKDRATGWSCDEVTPLFRKSEANSRGESARTRTQLEHKVRREVEHTYHPACTARIGTEADGVVDAELRVHGVEALRVADASVFSTVTHGNTHAPSVLVGEKAADLIRASN